MGHLPDNQKRKSDVRFPEAFDLQNRDNQRIPWFFNQVKGKASHFGV